jgi:signal transduction histidine kinase
VKPAGLRLVFFLTVFLPVAGLAALGARAIQQEEVLLAQRESQRAGELARSVRAGLRQLLLAEARHTHTRMREALAAEEDLSAVLAVPKLGTALIVDQHLELLAPRRGWSGAEPDLPPSLGELAPVLRHERAGQLGLALATLSELNLGDLPSARNLHARLLLKLGRREEALVHDRWLKTQPAVGGLPLAWIALEREIETLVALDRKLEAAEAVDAGLRRLLGDAAGAASPGACAMVLTNLGRWGRELGVFGGLLRDGAQRGREARAAAELLAYGSLSSVDDLDALDARFSVAPRRGACGGVLVFGPEVRVKQGRRRAVLAVSRAELEGHLEHVVSERSSAEAFAVSLEPANEGEPLTPAGLLHVIARPMANVFSVELAERRTLQRLALLGLLVVLAAIGTWATYRGVRRSAELSRVRADFAASVTHELRTPLTSIRAMAEILSLGRVKDPERQSFYFSAIAEESQRLGRLIEDVLTVSKVERDGFRVDLKRAAPTPGVKRIVDAFSASPVSRGLPVEFEAEAQTAKVLWDEILIERALTNLLVNAIKYGGDEPAIRVTVRALQRETWGVEIAVHDRGPGIPPAEQERILKPFERGKSATSTTKPGAGLGLAIVAGIAHAHQGEMTLESELGRGTTFAIWLPAVAGGLTRA